MEARRSNRVIVNFPAEIIHEDRRYAASVENLSPEGAYVVTASGASTSREFSPHSTFELRFKFPSGEQLNLKCRVIWSYATPPHGYTQSIGAEFIEPPPVYQETLKTLQ